MWKRFKIYVRLALHYAQFAGRGYYCPLCYRHARIFTPSKATLGQPVLDKYHIVSMGQRPHYRCPWCNSSDKERLVWMFLERKSNLLAGAGQKSVLHVAPERNTMRRLKEVPNLVYVAGDMFEGNDEKYTPERYGGAVYLDITDMSKFEDNRFDAVICNHVMEHVQDDARGMREIFRVVKGGGLAVLQTPVSHTISTTMEDAGADTPQKRLAAFGQSDHVRIYAEADYLQRLAAAGFKTEAVAVLEFLSHDEAVRLGVNLKEKVYAVRKPESL